MLETISLIDEVQIFSPTAAPKNGTSDRDTPADCFFASLSLRHPALAAIDGPRSKTLVPGS